MKKLGKLSINPEKVIKNEELVNLRGGYFCEECGDCSGDYIICLSNFEQFWADMVANCGESPDINVEVLYDC
jgi:natural product precursor